MAVINTNLTCELQEAVKVQYLKGNLFSQDNQGNVINVTVFDGGEPATLSGSVTANIIRPDGGTVTATGGTITGNVASITLPAAAYAIPGVVSIVVKLTASSVITTIAAVVATMYKSSTDTVVDPGTIIPSVQALVTQIETAVASIPADYSSLWTSLAPAFSSSSSYTAGQYVTYDGGVYIFTADHTGSWNASHVAATNIGGQLASLKNAISAMLFVVPITSENVESGFTKGADGRKIESDNYKTVRFIPIDGSVEGSAIIIDVSLVSYAGVAFYNENKTYISGYNWATNHPENSVEGFNSHLHITIPQNAKYISTSLANANYSAPSDFFIGYYVPSDYYANIVETNMTNKINNDTEKIDESLGRNEITFTAGAYIKNDGDSVNYNSPISDPSYMYAVIGCKPGDIFEIHLEGGGSARPFAFVKSNGTKIAGSANTTQINGYIIAPKDAEYLVLNKKTSVDLSASFVGLEPYHAIYAQNFINSLPTLQKSGQPLFNAIESGAIRGSNGCVEYYAGTTRARLMPGILLFSNPRTVFSIEATSGVQFYVLKETTEGVITTTSWDTSYNVTESAYYSIVFRYSDNREITDSMFGAIIAAFDVKIPTEEQIMIESWKNEWFYDISHRGYMYEAPQSTVAAFVRAKVKGYNAIECDVRVTSDGEFVIHHDAGMPSDSSYKIAEHTLAELRSNANMGTYNGIVQQILTFKDLILLAKQLDVNVFLELKAELTTSQIANLMEIALKLDMQDRVLWMASYNQNSFNYAGYFRTNYSKCYLLITDTREPALVSNFVIQGDESRTIVYSSAINTTEQMVSALSAIKVYVVSWCVSYSSYYPDYTESEIKAEIQRCINCGIRGIALDQWTAAELTKEQYKDYLT